MEHMKIAVIHILCMCPFRNPTAVAYETNPHIPEVINEMICRWKENLFNHRTFGVKISLFQFFFWFFTYYLASQKEEGELNPPWDEIDINTSNIAFIHY